MKFNKITQHLTKFHCIKICFHPILLLFVLDDFKSLLQNFGLDQTISNFGNFRLGDGKRSISQYQSHLKTQLRIKQITKYKKKIFFFRNRRMSWMSPLDAEREKLEGVPLTVCTDCKEMVLQVSINPCSNFSLEDRTWAEF